MTARANPNKRRATERSGRRLSLKQWFCGCLFALLKKCVSRGWCSGGQAGLPLTWRLPPGVSGIEKSALLQSEQSCGIDACRSFTSTQWPCYASLSEKNATPFVPFTAVSGDAKCPAGLDDMLCGGRTVDLIVKNGEERYRACLCVCAFMHG